MKQAQLSLQTTAEKGGCIKLKRKNNQRLAVLSMFK